MLSCWHQTGKGKVTWAIALSVIKELEKWPRRLFSLHTLSPARSTRENVKSRDCGIFDQSLQVSLWVRLLSKTYWGQLLLTGYSCALLRMTWFLWLLMTVRMIQTNSHLRGLRSLTVWRILELNIYLLTKFGAFSSSHFAYVCIPNTPWYIYIALYPAIPAPQFPDVIRPPPEQCTRTGIW